MSSSKSPLLLSVLVIVLAALLLSSLGARPAEADPLGTRTISANSWNFLPIVRGEATGPTATPELPLSTPTDFPTATNTVPATQTATQQPPATNTASAPTSTAQPSNTPTNTAVPTNTAAPTATPTSTTQAPPSNTGDVRITEIFFDGAVYRVESDEYVEIKNYDDKVIKLGGWKLHDEGVKHTYTFPKYDMEPGEVCRVYTNENHPEWCGFNWGNGSAIWNNDGDEATLKDGGGKVIDTCSYSGSGTRKNCE